MFVFILNNCNKKPDVASIFEIDAGSRTLNFDAEAGRQTVTVNANVDFTAVSSHPEWCMATVLNSTTDNLNIVVSKNASFDMRSANVTVSAKNMQDLNVEVIQTSATPVLSVTQENVIVLKRQLEFSLDVHANFPVVFDLPEWISEKDKNDWVSGTKKYSFTVSPFSQPVRSRKATVTVRAASSSMDIQPVSVSVEQMSEGLSPAVCGSFVQDWLVSNWDDARWDREFKDLKDAGMEYLIFSPSLQTDVDGTSRALYPSTLTSNSKDLIEICLRNAQKNGFKIFISLNMHERWWSLDYSPEWLYNQMNIGNQVADELISIYKDRYGETMYGWYWVWEIDNLNWNTTVRREALINSMNINRDHLATVTPSMPFMLSPFWNYEAGYSEDNFNMWQDIFNRVHFREGDIFAPQDGVGAGGLTTVSRIEQLPEWFSKLEKAAKTKPGLLFWANVEIFNYPTWTSATVDRFVKQMEQVEPYVSNMITFAYSHYYSPLNVNRQLHDAYLYYLQNGVLPNIIVPSSVVNAVIVNQTGGQTVLKWDAPQNTAGLLGYRIYKNNVLIGELQCSNTDCTNTFTDVNGGSGGIYAISSYNAVGQESSKNIF